MSNQVHVKICPNCQISFGTHHNQKIYCSPECCKQAQAYKAKIKNLSYWEILNRDNFTCQYCGKNPTEDDIKLVFDHIKPKVDGGRDTPNNLVTSCKRCNSAKCNRPLRHEAEFRKRIQRRTGSLQTAFDFMIRPIERGMK